MLMAVPSNIEVKGLRANRTVANGNSSDTTVKSCLITFPGTYRIEFELQVLTGFAGDTLNGQIYQNGTAVGSRRVLTWVSNTGVRTQYVEDIGGWAMGDTCALKVSVGVAEGTYAVQGFVVKGSYNTEPTIPIPAGNTVTDANI